MLWLKCLSVLAAIIFARTIGSPVLPKWKAWLIWLGTIALFQAVELDQYLDGKPYRPIFGVVAAVMVAGLSLHARAKVFK